MTLNCKIIKHEYIQQYMVGRVEKYEQISKLPTSGRKGGAFNQRLW